MDCEMVGVNSQGNISALGRIMLYLKNTVTETSDPKLANLLYWLMVFGYSIRNTEVRFDMEKVLGAPPKLAELTPGENI